MAGDYPTRGYFLLGEFNHAAIRVHFLTLLGALFISGGKIEPVKWVAYFFLVLIHEFGHAIAVWNCGLRVTSIDVLPIGGLCRFRGSPTPLQSSIIAFAGIWAQLAAYGVAWVALTWFREGLNPRVQEFLWVFILPNLIMAAINLIPVEPLDGTEAWLLFPRLFRRVFRKGRVEKARARVDALDARLKGDRKKEKNKEWMN